MTPPDVQPVKPAGLDALEPRLLFSADPIVAAGDNDTGHGHGCCCPCCAAADSAASLPPGHFHGDGHDHGHHTDEYGVAFDPLHWFTGSALPTTAPADPATNGPRSGATFSLSDVPELESDPDSSRTLYLDFNGETIDNTLWNDNYHGGDTIHAPAFDLDGDITSFSQAELDQIVEVWHRVSEDFAPFDINVSTVAPPAHHFTQGSRAIRVLVSSNIDHAQLGGDGTAWYEDAGGVARIGSWRYTSDTPAWVFSNLLQGSAKNVAEAVSHEAGHTFGLTHDGLTDGTTYYTGHGSGATGWAPIMGASYDRPVTQWSRGEYDDANNTQDDLAVITQSSNQVDFRDDDHGDSRSSASLIEAFFGGRSVGAAGLIATSSDIDYFAFDTAAGDVELTIAPAALGANLDIRARLYDDSGSVIDTSDSTSRLGASFSETLAAGRYYVSVEGVGRGDPGDTGYSDYASIGRYHLVGSVQPVDDAQLPPPLLGDVDGDYAVGQADLAAVSAAWGLVGADLAEDLNGDGMVSVADLDIVLQRWGESVDLTGDLVTRYLVPTDGSLGAGWVSPGFDDSGWAFAVPGVGYETSGSDYAPLLATTLPSGTVGAYLRTAFEADGPGGLEGFGLTVRYDDGFVAYLNGVRVASANAPDDPEWDDRATDSHDDADAARFAWFDLAEHMGLLNDGENTLAVHLMNNSPSSSDLLLEAELVRWGSGGTRALSAIDDPRPTRQPSATEAKKAGRPTRETAADPAALRRQGVAAWMQQRGGTRVDALASAVSGPAPARGVATTPRHVAALLL